MLKKIIKNEDNKRMMDLLVFEDNEEAVVEVKLKNGCQRISLQYLLDQIYEFIKNQK